MSAKTLADVARLTLQGDSFDRCLANFLDQFYAAPSAATLSEAPILLQTTKGELGRIEDAYLAATAEELARRFFVATPEWVMAEERKLHHPWFASPLASLRTILLSESPAAFRARNLFVSENALFRV